MGRSGEEYTVKFANTGEEITVSSRETILDACLENGVAQEYSCRVGMCLACIAELVEGDVKQPGARGLSDEDQEEYVLTCMARAESDLVLRRGVYPPSIENTATSTAMSDGGFEGCRCSNATNSDTSPEQEKGD